MNVTEFLGRAVVDRVEIDRFLDPDIPKWAQFDPELGYTLHDSFVCDGMDGSWTIGCYGTHGERRVIQYADRPCRINTYGDSFTMCHQVNDGETWQEYLAAHLGEPIRNFGVGGYGVYQAYRRMVRTEQTDAAAPFIVLNLWGSDDHHRSLCSWRYLRCLEWFKDPRNRDMFHSNPWAHLAINPDTGAVEERESLCPTPESLYRLCDRDWVQETFRDDVSLHMHLASSPGHTAPLDQIQQLADALGMGVDLAKSANPRAAVAAVHDRAAFRATCHTLEMARAFTEEHSKRLLVLLSYGDLHVAEYLEGKPRLDAPVFDYLNEGGFLFADSLDKHREDFANFNLNARDYIKRYYIGHYSPTGNHFFAFAVKDAFVGWLDPRPVTYRQTGDSIGFRGYLEAVPDS